MCHVLALSKPCISGGAQVLVLKRHSVRLAKGRQSLPPLYPARHGLPFARLMSLKRSAR